MDEEKKKPSETDLQSEAYTFFGQARNAQEWVRDIWLKSGYAYDSRFAPEDKKVSNVFLGQSRLFIPKTYTTIQRILADIMETFFFDPDEIVGVKSTPGVPSEMVRCVKALLNHRLNGHPINFYEQALDAILDALKQKVGIFKIYPRLRVREEKKTTKKKDDQGIETEMVEPMTLVDAFEPMIESVAPEDLFIHPYATWKDYWKFPMMHRCLKSKRELLEKGYEHVDEVQWVGDYLSFDQMKQARHWQASPFHPSPTDREMEYIFDYEFWTTTRLKDGGPLVPVVMHYVGGPEGPQFLAVPPQENTLPYSFSEFEDPRPPFVIGSPMPEPHKMYGKDIAEVTDGLQKEVNSLRNQDREAAAIAIRAPLLVQRDANLDMMSLVNRRIGGMVSGDQIGPDAVRKLDENPPVIQTAQVSARNEQDYFEATSITPGQLGISTRDETATAVTSNQNNANKKIQSMVRNLAATLLLPAFRYLLRLEQAYERDEYVRMVTGKYLGWNMPNDGVPSWEAIQGDFDLTVELGIAKAAQMNKYLLIADRINQTNGVMMQMVQAGVINPQVAGFINPKWAFNQLMATLKHHNVEEMMLPAQAPPPDQPEGRGLASQPGNVQNPDQQNGQLNPEMLSELLG